MNGYFLRLLVLKHLKDGKKTGYDLMKDIREHIGWKPSPGSMYPLLESLLSEKMVQAHTIGRKHNYTLTKKGQDAVRVLENKKKELIESMQKHIRMFEYMDVAVENAAAEKVISRLKDGIFPFKEFNPELTCLGNEFLRVANLPNLKRTEINKIKKLFKSVAKELSGIA